MIVKGIENKNIEVLSSGKSIFIIEKGLEQSYIGSKQI